MLVGLVFYLFGNEKVGSKRISIERSRHFDMICINNSDQHLSIQHTKLDQYKVAFF